MGNYDQFTDVSLFPTAVGDAQLPPGMLREKHSGLDKSLMGLEMRGGGGGGTTHVENDYDDAWIKTWTGDAEGRETDYVKRLDFLETTAHNYAGELDLGEWERALLKEQQDALGLQQDTLGGQIGDLGTRFDQQEAAWNVGLQSIEAATTGLEAATTGIDARLGLHSGQIDEQLRLAQQNMSNELAVAQSGWDTTKAAWEQAGVDWEKQFAQQQRQIETQLATEKEEYRDQIESIQSIYGVQSEEQRTAWEQQAAGQREMFSDQLANLNEVWIGQNSVNTEAWEQRFAQAQEDQRIANAVQDRDREASLVTLGNTFQQDWASKSQLLQSEYQNLIGQAKDDAAVARAEQALKFEQMQLDQAAAYNLKDQELAAQDRIFGGQIDELRRDLGIETDLRGQAQRDFAEKQELENLRLSESIGNLGKSSAVARQELGETLAGQQQAHEMDVTETLGGFREDVQDYKATLDQQKAAQDEYYAANKRFREMQIQDAERARTAASYGSPGTTLNQQVKGVRRAGSSQGLKKSRSPRNVFNRSGLRISSLNI